MRWPPKWYDRAPEWVQDVVDQIGHVGIGGVPAAILGGALSTIIPSGWAGLVGAIAGSIAMIVYELIQNWGDDDNDYDDMRLDLAVGCSTAVVVGFIVGVAG